MTYPEFRETIQSTLVQHASGLTWSELRDQGSLPYQRACPEWTRRLESDIGLDRTEKRGNSLVWKIGNKEAAQPQI
ncbi:MAG: hypothetical protein AAF236_00345 [Verrucomicrobiota bacterium]